MSSSTQPAEDFINISELRHLAYEHIATDDLAAHKGFLLSCSTIHSEATASLLKSRRAYIAAETKRWSAKYNAPIRIIQKLDTLRDSHSVEVELPSSMVYDDSVLKTIETEHRRNGAAFPMSGIPLYKLEFTTYVDDSEQEVDSEIMLRFARLLHSAVLRTNYELNTQSGVEREGVEASLPIKAKIVIFDWRYIFYPEGVLDENAEEYEIYLAEASVYMKMEVCWDERFRPGEEPLGLCAPWSFETVAEYGVTVGVVWRFDGAGAKLTLPSLGNEELQGRWEKEEWQIGLVERMELGS